MDHKVTSDFNTWDRRYRGHFMNSLSGFKPVSLIGTWNEHETANLAVFSNIVHLGADPALVGIVCRPMAAGGHTLTNIKRTGWFTINHVHPGIMEQAHQCSARYPAAESELEAVGLTLFLDSLVHAPFVEESRIKFGVALKQVIPIAFNDTFFVIGQVESVWLSNHYIKDDGYLDLAEAQSMCSSGLDGYHTANPGHRIPYAKVPTNS
ncbi:MAG: flavin reductase family protein [Flavobacteriales bacterium]